jgi:hypothetical protein
MIPPVEVPETRSNVSLIGRLVCASIAASTIAGMTPQIPPPSTARTLNAGAIRPLFPRAPSNAR